MSGIALTAEYKHLDELAKMMIMKLKDIMTMNYVNRFQNIRIPEKYMLESKQ